MRKETIKVVSAEIERDGHYLLTQRRKTSVHPLLWEFPGGKIEEGEEEREALKRELKERLDIDIEVGPLSMIIKKEYDKYNIELYLYRCSIIKGEIRLLKVNDYRWVHHSELNRYEYTDADQEIVDKILSELHSND